jgi:hypothetical protein
MRNRTADLLLTMETLCLLSYRGASMPLGGGTNRPTYTLGGGQGESHPMTERLEIRRTLVTSPPAETYNEAAHSYTIGLVLLTITASGALLFTLFGIRRKTLATA